MNKKDIAKLRKEFKEDSVALQIKHIFNVYIKKESGEIYHQVSQPFGMLEQEHQDLFMANFKKTLMGNLDAKLFELKFEHGVEDSTQSILYNGLQTKDAETWNEEMLKVVAKMFKDVFYTVDTVVTFIRGEYNNGTSKRSEESEEGGNDTVSVHPFILCTVNRTEQPKKSLLFDYNEKEFKSNSVVDPIINLSSPIVGFMFPTFTEHAMDVNHVLYSAGKANYPDPDFIEKVLNCQPTVTAQDDKEFFEEILQNVIGEKVDTETISNIYREIGRIVGENEESEPAMLDAEDIEAILGYSGVEDTEKVGHAFKEVIEQDNYELKASSLLPPKSVKIDTKVATVSIDAKEINKVRQVTHKGKRCLLIEIDEDARLEGFKLETVTL